MTQTSTISKYSYWVDDAKLKTLKKQMEEKGIAITQAKQNPCEVLVGDIGYAEPHVWSAICKYDAAPWYSESKFAGKNLIVSSFPLDKEYEEFLETTIEPVSFDPPYIPNPEEIKELVKNKKYTSSEPADWGKFPKEMGEAIVQGLAKMHGTESEKFEDLLCTWTAVHSNFVDPKHRAGSDYDNAPYSIADSAHISSCCVELFNLIDTKEKALLVRPCVGAVIVKAFTKDQYYIVKIVKNRDL